MRHILIIGAGAIGAYLVRELHKMYPDAKMSCIDRSDFVGEARKRLQAIAGTSVEVYDRVDAVRGLNVTITTTAATDEEGRALLRHLGMPLRAEGYTAAPGEDRELNVNYASPGYFDALGIPLRHGRTFTTADAGGGRPVVVVNETLARKFFGGDAVGKRLTDSSNTVPGGPGAPNTGGYWYNPSDPVTDGTHPSETMHIAASVLYEPFLAII